MNSNQDNQLISVLLPVYNDENNIEESIKSILNQSYKNIELLVIDDASTDNTLSIVNSIIDKRIRVFKNETNLGITKSLNLIINESKGDLIARQDSDDISLENRLVLQYKALLKGNFDLVTSRALVKQNGQVIPRLSFYLPSKFLIRFKNPFIHGTLLIKKSVLFEVGLYDENLLYAQDYKLMMSLLQKNYKIKKIKKPLYILNTVDNISSNFKTEQSSYAKQVRKQYKSRL